jgi:hypothetical protein
MSFDVSEDFIGELDLAFERPRRAIQKSTSHGTHFLFEFPSAETIHTSVLGKILIETKKNRVWSKEPKQPSRRMFNTFSKVHLAYTYRATSAIVFKISSLHQAAASSILNSNSQHLWFQGSL